MYLTGEAKEKDVVLKIFVDDCPENPREWDNLGTMICWHRRYNLGDPHDYRNKDEFLFALLEESLGDMDKAERKIDSIQAGIDRTEYRSYSQYEKAVDDAILDVVKKHGFIVLPLYLYDHSGLTMRTYPFSCPWDSGQVGWVYVTKAKVCEKYSVKRVTKKVRERVIRALEAEVETYSQWLEGDVYGFVLEDSEGNRIDSCWGFFGTDWKENGMASQIPAEYRYLLEKVA